MTSEEIIISLEQQAYTDMLRARTHLARAQTRLCDSIRHLVYLAALLTYLVGVGVLAIIAFDL